MRRWYSLPPGQVRIGSTPIEYIYRLAACDVNNKPRAVARVPWKNDGGCTVLERA